MFLLNLPLLEGEPAAGAASTASLPASDATPPVATDTPAVDQPTPSESASTAVPADASDTPATVEDGKPAETPDGEPVDTPPDMSAEDFAALDDEAKSLFIAAYGTELLKTPEGQALVQQQAQSDRDRETAERANAPEADAVYQAMAGQVADHLAKLNELTDADPETIDPTEITANTALLHEWTEAATHRQNFQHANAALNEIASEVFGQIDPAKPPSDPAWLAANDAWKAAFKAYGESGVMVDRARKSNNPKTRASAPELEAKRHAAFIKTTVRIAMDIGKAQGSAERAKADAPKVAEKVQLAKNNSYKLALANVAARNGNGVAAAAASGTAAQGETSDAARQQRLAYGNATAEDRAWLQKQYPG